MTGIVKVDVKYCYNTFKKAMTRTGGNTPLD